MSGQLKLLHMSSVIHYPGEELELFEEAKNWKAYMSGMLQPYIRGKVLEVGAGMGETTCYLFTSAVSQWTCLEPDPNLFALLEKKKRENTIYLCRNYACEKPVNSIEALVDLIGHKELKIS